jgi:NADH dehydrogenase FAD-containing subunit
VKFIHKQIAKHLVLVGGGHAHLMVLSKLKEYTGRGHRVTLISPSAYHYYSGMGPGMLSGFYHPREIRFHIKKMAEDRGASYFQDAVIRVDPARRGLQLQSGSWIEYDVVSFNVGSDIFQDNIVISGGSVLPVKPIKNLLKARELIMKSFQDRTADILVVGGGPAGLEISGNVWKLLSDNGIMGRITVVSGGRMLAHFPDRARTIAFKSLRRRSIDVLEDISIRRLERGKATLTDGTTLACDIVLLATGVKPPLLFLKSGLETSQDGALPVNAYLQSVSYPEIFGGGDCISFQDYTLPKVGVHAVKESRILFNNLHATLNGGELMRYKPQRNYLLIFNLGDGRALLWRQSLVIEGKAAWWLKNYIDRKFIRKFQLSGELDEK